MKKWEWMLVLCAALACLGTAALAEERTVTLPGRTLNLNLTKVGEQVRGGDCDYEEIWQMQVSDQGAAQPFQTLYFTKLPNEAALLVPADVNMDGYDDLDILYSQGASNSQHTFFFWNPNENRFEINDSFYAWLSNYVLYPEEGLLLNSIHDSAFTGTEELYRWADGRLRLIRRADILFDETKSDEVILSIAEPNAEGYEMRETYRQTLNLLTASETEQQAFYEARETLLWQGIRK